MIIDINQEMLAQIKNPSFAAYAGIYMGIERQFMEQVRGTGIEVAARSREPETAERLERLQQKGATSRNDGKSIYVNGISPACLACQKGVDSVTLFISLKCHRHCFYCFNPNQENYARFRRQKLDVVQELEQIDAAGQTLQQVALTGGEPLLFKDDVLAFYRHARARFPGAYTRLYTSGDQVDDEILQALQEARLDEIRFSMRVDDLQEGHREAYERIALARRYIPQVMVEMPVLPGTQAAMRDLLLELDRLGATGINLLELCFPWANAQAFNVRSYRIKARPYRALYNYWYAGGLPVDRSELECLDLLEFALDRGLRLGVHYCSLENKHTGQIYQQNTGHSLPPTAHFSERDYFLKTAKVFGADVTPVLEVFQKVGYSGYRRDHAHDLVEFDVARIPDLKSLDVEIGISSAVMETREDGEYLRELKVDLTDPHSFDLARDV